MSIVSYIETDTDHPWATGDRALAVASAGYTCNGTAHNRQQRKGSSLMEYLCPCTGQPGLDSSRSPSSSNSQVQSLLSLLSRFQSNKTYASGMGIYAQCPVTGHWP